MHLKRSNFFIEYERIFTWIFNIIDFYKGAVLKKGKKVKLDTTDASLFSLIHD